LKIGPACRAGLSSQGEPSAGSGTAAPQIASGFSGDLKLQFGEWFGRRSRRAAKSFPAERTYQQAILLACIQLSRLNDFNSREVSFSRYEILRLLGWADETRNYDRVATSLRRWKGLSNFSDRAFYDHEQKSWVNRDFGVFDNLVIYRREVIQGKAAPGCSRFVWNEVLFRSFQSGYLK